MSTEPAGRPPAPELHRPAVRRTVGALLVLMLAAMAVGHAFTPVLLRESPVLLLAVLSSYVQMGLASARVDPVTLVAVAALRRWAGETIAFAAGRVFGEQGVGWFERRAGLRYNLADLLNRRWWPVRDAVVLLIPHPLLSAAVGAARMPPARFAVLKLLGSVGSVTLFWYVAGAAASPLDLAAGFVEANAIVLTGLGVAGAAMWLAWLRRRTDLEPPG